MKNKFSRFLSVVMAICLMAVCFTGCSSADNDIIILFTNDAGCAVEGEMGYTKIAAYKKLMLKQTPHVKLVDLGDAVQGDFIGTISKGDYIVDLMNKVGYDYAVPGNHEFDYGMEQLTALINRSDAKYLVSNIEYKGEGESALKDTKPYEIVNFDGTKVAFIGVTTPHTLTMSLPSNFIEEEIAVYDFKNATSGSKLYNAVQGYVNECKNKGADYVVILSHLGDTTEATPYTSTGLIKATFDVDVVLDAHTGGEISCRSLCNKNGEDVLLSSAGKDLSSLGKLVISANGNISTGLVSGYATVDEDFETYYQELKLTYEEQMNQVLAICDKEVKRTDLEGVETIANRENPLGNFCADAYRIVADADVALVPADRINADLPIGDVRYADVLKLFPSGGELYKIKITGQEILDCLEIGCANLETEYAIDGKPVGVNANFMQVSGLQFKVDTSIKSTVQFDEFGNFKDIDGKRRVKSVKILNDNLSYTPINPKALYTLATDSLLVKEGVGGITFLQNNPPEIGGGMPDYQVLLDYLMYNLGGELGERYAIPEGRIIVE